MQLPPDFAAGMFYNDLEPEQARRWTALLRAHSVGYVSSRCLNTFQGSRY